MKHIVPLILFVILLTACGPDRAQTINPPAPTDEPTPTVEATAAEPTAQLPTPTDEPQPTDEPTAAPATPEPEPTAEPAGDTADVDQEALLAALLTLDDMPTGWTGTAPTFERRTPGGTYSAFCTELTARSIVAAEVEFQKSGFGPFFSQTIVVYPDAAAAADALEEIISAAQDCPEVVDSQGNTNINSPLSFPSLGEETFAMRASGLVEMDIVKIRIDNVLLDIYHSGLGAVDSTQTETFARAAVERYSR